MIKAYSIVIDLPMITNEIIFYEKADLMSFSNNQ